MDDVGLGRAQTREVIACSSATALLAAAIHLAVPQPGDAAAHLYRTFLVLHGVFVWDNFWFAGQYPLASYSLLYYWPAAVVGNLPLVAASAIASTAIFASIASREWGSASLWPVRAFAVFAAAPLFTGLYSYSVGLAIALGSLRLFQARRPLAGLTLAALALGFSPLAFVFLCLVLAAFFVGRSTDWRRGLKVGIGLLVLIGAQLCATFVFFQSRGVYPFHRIALAAVLGVATLGVLVARRSSHSRPLGILFAFWGVGAIVWFIVPSPLGDNWTRLSAFLFPLMLATAALARFRPRPLVALALAGALAYNLTPYFLLIPFRMDSRPAHGAFWRPALQYLHAHMSPAYRVEVVPTAAHWEAYWLPRYGYALARGFYDQLDLARDPAVYRPHVDARAYRRWLDTLAVEYVLLPSTKLDRAGGVGEARLLRSGQADLPIAYRTASWTIYRVPHPKPLLTGPGRAVVTRFGHETIAGRVDRSGRYLLRVHYAPYLVLHAPGCLRPSPGSMTIMRIRRPGAFAVSAVDSADGVLDRALAKSGC